MTDTFISDFNNATVNITLCPDAPHKNSTTEKIEVVITIHNIILTTNQIFESSSIERTLVYGRLCNGSCSTYVNSPSTSQI